MPIPEPGIYRPSNLTKQQRHEQTAAIYGVPVQNDSLSEQDIARMRQILLAHDAQKQVPIHDLNNPPRESYKFQKFPMMVYDLERSHMAYEEERAKGNGFGVEMVHVPAKIISRLVHDERQLQQVLSEGWSEQAPEFREEESEFATGATKYSREAQRVDDQIEQARRKPGRPAKVHAE